RPVDMSEVAVLPRLQCDFTARVSGNHLIRLAEVRAGRVPEAGLAVGQHSLSVHPAYFTRVRASVLARYPEQVIRLRWDVRGAVVVRVERAEQELKELGFVPVHDGHASRPTVTSGDDELANRVINLHRTDTGQLPTGVLVHDFSDLVQH